MHRQPTPPQRRRDRRAQARLEPRPARRRPTRAATRPAWQSPVVLMTVAAIAVGIGIIAFANRPTPPTTGVVVTPSIPYTAESIDGDALGSAAAPVVMELYADFQCPACKLFVTTQLSRLWTDFIQPGTLRIEARDIAFLGTGNPDESLELAAGAACATEQDRYWQYHDYAYWNQGRENRGDHSASFIADLADAAGAEATAWQACFARDDIRSAIRRDTTAAQGLGVTSTPTLVMNGEKIVGVPDYEALAARIRALAGPSAAPSASPS